jgi:hypothetical protein
LSTSSLLVVVGAAVEQEREVGLVGLEQALLFQ